MDFIIELVMEIIMEGAIEAAESRRVPWPVRILLIAFLLVFFLGLFAILLIAGISNDSVVMIVIAFLYLVAVIAGVVYKVRKYKKTL